MVKEKIDSNTYTISDVQNDIMAYEELMKNVMNVFTSVLNLGNHFERFARVSLNCSGGDFNMKKLDNSSSKKSNSRRKEEKKLFNKSDQKENDMDLIRFTNTGPIFSISKSALDSVKGSYIDEQRADDLRTNDGTIFLGYDGNDASVYYLLDYLNGKPMNLNSVNYLEQLEVLNLFEFCGLAIPEELIDCRGRRDRKRKRYEEPDEVHLFINGKEDTIISNYLKKNNLWSIYIRSCDSGYVYYNHKDNSLFMDKNYQYIEYINTYIKLGTIYIEDTKKSEINQELLEIEMSSLFGNKGKEVAQHASIPFQLFNGTTIISNKLMEAPLVNWINNNGKTVFMSICDRFSSNEKKWTLLFRASEHHYSASQFHKYCDNKGETITLIKHIGHNNHINIFGGYTNQSWESRQVAKYYSKEFIFTLSNEHDIPPTKYDNLNDGKSYGIYCDPSYGPTFGNKWGDIKLADKCHTNDYSYCNSEAYTEINIPQKCRIFVNTADTDYMNNFFVEDYEVWGKI
ncbi:hypothetical protein WA158_007149 [Blastocystis sp. Blastoise]